MEVNGVAHVMLRVSRFEECIRFYDELMPALGLSAVHRSEDFVYYIGGRTALAIRQAERSDHMHVEGAPGLDHICFRARSRQDIDDLHPLLERIGADIVRPPEEGPWAPGYYSLSFRDPEGIRLEVNHVPGKGVFAEGASFDPAPDYPLGGRRESGARAAARPSTEVPTSGRRGKRPRSALKPRARASADPPPADPPRW